jgi:hypothetical protein
LCNSFLLTILDFHISFLNYIKNYNQCMPEKQHDLSNDINYNKTVTLAGMSEKSLAAYQHNQVGNTCTLHSISAAIQLLSGRVIDPAELADELDAMNFFRRLPYRFGINGPVSPLQQVALLRRLINDLGLSLQIGLSHPTIPGLIDLIHQPDTVVMVTIGWAKHAAPAITLGAGTSSYANNISITWHTIISAAYDPMHIDTGGLQKPWGFINSWVNGGEYLFWMADGDFRKAWSFYTPLGGFRPAVIITKK